MIIMLILLTASTDVSTRKCFVQIQLRVINFHPWFQCFVPKRVHAILQDTHIGDVNAVFRRSMEWGSWVAGLDTSLPMMQSSSFAHHPLAKSYTFRTVSCSSLEECVELLRSIVCNITNTNLVDNDSPWLQASLPVTLVGLASEVECGLHLQPSCSTS